MSVVEDGSTVPLVQRVKGILLTPKAEWERIDLEPATPAGLYRGYIVILAAIAPICTVIGSLVFGFSFFGVTIRPSPVNVIVSAALAYLMSLVAVYVVALVIDALAPNFGAEKNRIQALKVATYAWTAAWIGGVFNLIPALALIGIQA